jgi:signal recognition particle GTPase
MEGGLQEPAEARAEEGMGAMHETGLASEEEQRERLAEKMPEHEGEEEEEKAKRTRKKKKTPKSKRKEQEYSITDIGKQIEKQTNYLARLEQILQPLRKLVKSSDVQSKLVKDINASVKQMERQIIQIRKAIQKGKTRKK